MENGQQEWAAYLFESVENGKLTSNEAATMSRAAVEPTSSKAEDGKSFGPPRAKDRQPLPTPPKRIAPAVRLKNDTSALGILFAAKLPAQVLL